MVEDTATRSRFQPASEAQAMSGVAQRDLAAQRRDLANPTSRAGIPVIRPNIKVRQMFHHAYRAQDSAATRHFYEDLLGMPLLACFVETEDPATGAETNYIHTYYGLGDGSALAFFQFEHDNDSVSGFRPANPFDQHIALYMDSLESLHEVQSRLTAAEVPFQPIDHGYCYSLYIHDPNGLQVEVAVDVPGTDAIMREAESVARQTLDAWLGGIRDGNNHWRGHGLSDSSQ